MIRTPRPWIALLAAVALAFPPPAFAQASKPVALAGAQEGQFNTEQLDALLAPIALYPDELLTQVLMASTYPLQIVAASRWFEKAENKELKGDSVAKALERENWDPSVKSLVPFPQVLAMLNENLEWTQQLGYAVAMQQAAVLDSIQRLRQQAQNSGNLKSTEQQRVERRDTKIIIQPASPDVVYVPMYKPAEVYGPWPYPSYPPVYLPPPAAYYPPGYAFGAGVAFATGVAVVGGLWGWANPNWRNGNVTISQLPYTQINVNRTAIQSNIWQAPRGAQATQLPRIQNGPVGAPARLQNLPANAVGRANVQVPAAAVNRPQIQSGGTRPVQGRADTGVGQRSAAGAAQLPSAGDRRGGGGQQAAGQRAAAGQLPSGGQRANTGQSPAGPQRPAPQPAASQRGPGVFGGIGDGNRAAQFEARGAQSRALQQRTGFQGRAAGGGGLRRR